MNYDHDYEGEERRGHCDVHHDNTKTLESNSNALSGILMGIKVIAWVIVLSFPTTVALGAYFGSTLDAKLEAINKSVTAIATGQVLAESKIAGLEQDTAEIKQRLCELEERVK